MEPDDLEAAARAVSEAARAGRGELARLADLVERLGAFERRLEAVRDETEARMLRLGVSWTGQAAVEHGEAHVRWQAAAVEMHDAVRALGAIAGTARANYLAAVHANLQMWAP